MDEIQAVAFEGEPWLAFRDDSDCVGLRNCPLRIVRVHGACVYETAYELARRAER